jgi:NADH-quinone oxidoreductase subunit N
VAYASMTLGAFGVIIALSTPERDRKRNDLAGLSKPSGDRPCDGRLPVQPRQIPPAGFYGKFAIFTSVLELLRFDSLWWLASSACWRRRGPTICESSS